MQSLNGMSIKQGTIVKFGNAILQSVGNRAIEGRYYFQVIDNVGKTPFKINQRISLSEAVTTAVHYKKNEEAIIMNATKMNFAREILENNMGGFTQEERENYINDVISHGCVSGVIYYRETMDIFTANMEYILGELEELKSRGMVDTKYDFQDYSTFYNEAVWILIEYEANAMFNELE